jgi:hypothetical protein
VAAEALSTESGGGGAVIGGRIERTRHQDHLDRMKQEQVEERLKVYLGAKADMERMLVKPI